MLIRWLFALISFGLAQATPAPIVDLGYAKYQGFYDATYDQNIFKGIRYAAPPVGELRWQMPQAPGRHRNEVISAVEYAPQCPQSPASPSEPPVAPSGDEDCLFLNVMAPANQQQRLPVLVWIHGGGYGSGNNRIEFMQQIRTNKNSYIVVSIAYRLGAFGFLSSAEVEKSGTLNVGIHDMRFALKWVQKNIHQFGGDPKRVTISGESAGGGSVMLLAMANGGREGHTLFQGLILSSPFLPTQWNYDDAWPTLSYEAFVEEVGCSDAEVIFECLQSADTILLQSATAKVSTSVNYGQWAFIPVTDGALIRKRPTEQLAVDKSVNGLRVLTGNNENEGFIFTPQNITNEEDFISLLLTNYPRLSEQNITSILDLYAVPENASEIYADTDGLTPPFSTTNSNWAVGWQQAADNLYAETTFVCPSYWIADAYAGARKRGSWKYQFSVPISNHGADVLPLITDPNVQGSGIDKVFRTAFQQIWGNFIVAGDPTFSAAQVQAERGNISAARTENWPQWGGRPEKDFLLNLNMTGGMPVTTATQFGENVVNLTSYVPSSGGPYPELEAIFNLVPGWSWEGGREKPTESHHFDEENLILDNTPGQHSDDTSAQCRPHNTIKMEDTANESSNGAMAAPFNGEDDIGHATAETNSQDETWFVTSATTTRHGIVAKVLRTINWMPPWCRYDPQNPPKFTLSMNILLAFSTTFTVANLYYPQPILNVIAEHFHVSYERSSNIATLSQAGYATGLLFLCPLGDIVPRRPFILVLILVTATMWIGLCLTTNFEAFVGLSFLCGVGTVTPQLMLPLVGDLAPAHRRAASLSIVVSGLALGLLVARVLSGVVANFTAWRNIYWIALGAQYLTFILLFFTLPDYPAKNKGLNYFKAIWKMATLAVEEPLLIQTCLMGFMMSAAFTNFWTTLTFLLASPPYNYSSLEVGLFAFIGIAVISLAPVWSRLITDKFVFLFSSLLGLSFELVGIIIGTFIGNFTVAGPIIQAIFMDTGSNFAHTANRSNIYGLDPKARNRVNTFYMVFCFAGQLTGTAAGNRLYAQGGWIWSGSMNIGLIGAAILIGLARGPRESQWVGWKGGWNIRRNENIEEKVEGTLLLMATDERTPLLFNGSGNGHENSNGHATHSSAGQAETVVAAASKTIFSPANRILLAGFLMAFTLGITQVPILYAFHLMECDIFYLHNPLFAGPADEMCHRREIDAGTALQFSILGMSTSLSSVFNLFICGYFIKLWGPRWSFVSQTSLLGLRVLTQIISVTAGGRTGELIFQICQGIGIIGGTRGYQLVLNTAVGEAVAAKVRTSVFGRLQGAIMLGTAFGYLLGGVLGDLYGIRRPFEVAFFLYVVSTLYGALFLPTKTSTEASDRKHSSRGLNGFFAPLKVIAPHKYRLESGSVIKNYGLIFLALGIFLGVFASGYAPLLLQMYATSVFHFSTTENGYLMFCNSLVRGLFLLFIFPKIITEGRIWFNGGTQRDERAKRHHNDDGNVPTNPEDVTATDDGECPNLEEEDLGIGFDLLFVRWSLVIDSLVTLFAGFSSAGWQVYLAGFLLPFASGSAPAAKGVMTEMCPPHQRQDAISAITLVESTAMLVTQGLFGLIFAAFSEMGKPSLTFFCNAGIAVLGFVVLFIARFATR
ncbi:hypothetical protein E0Z10_g9345 [Xylaria hypoxylon]|uniref:Major facilitator superfamily (MFS) profile domain-containing protein n=1 Tax=Xylaria hypoxylon TaxID=37992 RepID=A0A4Z0Y5V2_9PEZI|nr:hypothetical protein E0Z10_g9345 [Xylaria hypoxylon]